jgi:hypothetical protein
MRTLVLCTCLFAASSSFGQSPWTVTIIPPPKPLPIGFCNGISLTVLDASGQVPRNPRGLRISIADFDIAVTGPTVAGRRNGSELFDVCACQGGAAGDTGTITATYPARALDPALRVDVIVEQRVTFTLAAAKGPVNPAACIDRATSTAAISAPAAAVAFPPVTLAPAAAPIGAGLPDSAVRREPRYVAGPVTVTFGLNGDGSWYEPGPVTTDFDLTAQGAWFEPGPVTVEFGLSATGNWIEKGQGATLTETLQAAPGR